MRNILIITQKVDAADPILGFFHKWICAFAERCEHVTVIGQMVGTFTFPPNVTVWSLRKESGAGKVAQIFAFWKLICSYRKEYDAVFVHMTPVWVLFGAPLWLCIFHKPVYLWYEIKRGSFKLAVALLCVRKVFMASDHGIPWPSRKQIVTGHGIDTTLFVPDFLRRERGHIVAAGRLTGIKHYEVIVRVFAELSPECRLTIAGGTVTESDKGVEHDLYELIYRLGVADRVHIGWVAPANMPALLQRADVFVHASQGGLDKAILEAMACGCPVVSTSEAATDLLPARCLATPENMASRVIEVLALPQEERDALAADMRQRVVHHHNVEHCIETIVYEMQHT